MARRKGSGRGKSTANSRRTPLQNTREKSKDEIVDGNTKGNQQQNNDMDAATTAPKQYNKTKFQNNQRRNQTSNNITALSTKKQNSANNNNNNNSNNNANNLRTYRANDVEAGGSNEKNTSNTIMKTQKQATKQGRAAKTNVAATTTTETTTTTITTPTLTTATVGKEKEQKTAIKTNTHTTTTTTSTATTNGQTNKSDLVSNNRFANISSTNSSSTNNNNNNNNLNSDNSNSLIENKQQQTQYELNKTKSNNNNSDSSNNDNNKMLSNALTTTPAANSLETNDDDSWNNSKYLHKKFKRLASTTDIDGNATSIDESNSDAASKARTTSLSSASSSISSPPPSSSKSQATLTNGYHHHHHSHHQIDAHVAHSANAQMPPVNVVNAIVNINNNNNNSNQKENTKYNLNSDNNNSIMLLATPNVASNNNQQLTHTETLVTDNVAANCTSVNQTDASASAAVAAAANSAATTSVGRHVCPYCNLNCTKPSVLQKHIRAHTNERPFPCDICKIAFKTKSNYYKHCRSRSHAARSRGIEVPVEADETFSDQELSNSSSEVISRTDSPLDERSVPSPTILPAHIQQSQQSQHLQQPAIVLTHTQTPIASPSTLSATRTTYLQRPLQPQQLPLGSPAAGTLPSTVTTATMPQQNCSNNCATVVNINVQSKQQSLDFKPYKPKFHNAALYATTKDSNSSNLAIKQQNQTSLNSKAEHNEHLTGLQQQQPPTQAPTHPPPTPPHHASLSPVTHMKLNNHLNAQHQLQLQQHQQQQQQHILAPPLPPSNVANTAVAMPTPAGVYFLGQPPNTAALMHPGAATTHMAQQYYDPLAAAVAHQQALAYHMLTPHEQQFHHQYQMQQHHLQLQYQQEHQRQQQQQLPSSSSSATSVIKSHATQATIVSTSVQAVAQQRGNKTNSSQILTNGTPSTGNNNSTTASLIHGGVAGVASSGVHLNKEFLQEHISKLISQNEAIVENKELLLQKKYPKTLNRSRSFNNNTNNNGNSNSSNTSSSTITNSNLVTTTTINSESANAKLAQAIAQKKQMQMHQQQTIVQQQHIQYQQQQHQHLIDEVSTPQPQSHYPINGLSKQLQNTKQQIATATMQPQYRQQQNSTLATPQHVSPTLQLQSQHMIKEVLPMSLTNQSSYNTSPLNLSAKPKVKEIITSASSPAPTTASPSAPPTPKKRKSIEHQASTSSEASTSSVASSSTNNVSSVTANVNKPTQNTSIIKNILLNARGLAQPTGEGEHAVYVCPLCSLECRTAEDLQTHTGSYCHGSTNSAPITPIASPSHKYFRSGLNPLSLAKLSLAKLAWSQLKTKPSNGVLNRLSASQSSSSSKTTTTVTQTTTSAPSTLSIEHPFRLIDTPLPSPGPLLGKTPLVDSYNNNETQRKPENDVIITKMHEDRHQFTADHLPTSSKRTRYEASTSDCFTLTPPPSGLLMTANKRATGLSGGDIQPLNTLPNSNEIKKDERIKRFTSSGGSMIPISECSDLDKSPKLIRTPLLSGGSFQEVSPKKDKDGKNERLTICTPNIGGLTNVLGLPNSNAPQHFQFPPIVPITAFNPLTLPPLQTMTQAEKTIPYVPGIPGPNTPHTPLLPPPPQHLQLPQVAPPRNISPNRKSSTNAAIDINVKASNDLKNLSPFGGVQNVPSEFSRVPPSPALRNVRNWTPNSNLIKPAATMDATKKSFNFQRMADNLSQGKTNNATFTKSSPPEKERRHFNFDALAKEHDLNIQTAPPVTNRTNAVTSPLMPLHVDTTIAATSEQAPPTSSDLELKKSKFLRPTSLPLKPGTFTPKRHHGITPTANTLPLISPETPRPSKSCVQLYLNGHAYTYLGLKCSTKMFYCTVNCPQPSYVAGMHKLSMYSVWQVCAENNPHPLGLKPKEVMSLYDSRQKSAHATMAETLKSHYRLVTSQQTVMTPFADGTVPYIHHQIKQIASNEPLANEQIKKEFNENLSLNKDYMPPVSNVSTAAATTTAASQLVGGYESYEDYTYIRGRGRGRYVCSECGIRCKKPSMLKKHIRTHTDVRPYTCKHCNFSFKTKGNLTKHMQSKTHYKKCIELGINPGPMPADGEFQEPDMDCDQQSTTSAGGRTSSIPGESDSEDYSDNESESSGEFQEEQQKFNKKTYSNQTQLYTDNDESKSRLQEHEAARCLLSLSMTPPITQSVSPQLKTDGVSNYQSFNNEQTAAVFTTAPQQTSSTQQTSTIKRVVSFTQPKPPFDYQKQEQYYSNPEESKPKRNANANATTIYESAPIDLTKPRPNSTPAVPIKKEISTIVTTQTTTPTLDIVSIPGPVQTKAQIRDVIFGKSNNESGFLKTLISVSDKVRTSAENAENAKNIKENVLLQNYLKEQALQYHKIKQSQMSRNNFSTLEGNHQPLMHQSQCATPPVFTMSTTTNLGTPISSVLTVSSPVVVIPQITATAFKQEINRKSPEIKEQPQCLLSLKPESEIIKITEASKPIAAKQAHIDENESASDTEINATAKQTNKPISPIPEPYNANLPAAVHQPGTTDFSGVLSSTQPHTVTVGEDGFKKNTTNNNEVQPVFPRSTPVTSEGRPVCSVCFKSFQKQHQLTLHMNIHYMERRFRCEPCGVSFRTQGHFQKHERSEQHKSKVAMNSTFGKPSTSNPRPFECTDCKIAFRIHGHLAKHLRSKGHVQKLECLLKLPIGTYAEIERAGISLTEIDTSDCENSLISLKQLAQKLMEKDPTKLGNYSTSTAMNTNDNNSNTGIGSQDSASEDDGFSAAASAAASAIASLENDSPADTPRRANSTSEDESIAAGLNNLNNLGSGLKRRLPNSFSNGEESDNQLESLEMKRTRKTENTTPPVTSAGDAGAATLTPTSSVAN